MAQEYKAEVIWYSLSRGRSCATYCFSQLNRFLPQRGDGKLSRALSSYLVKSFLPASRPYRADSGPPVTPFPFGWYRWRGMNGHAGISECEKFIKARCVCEGGRRRRRRGSIYCGQARSAHTGARARSIHARVKTHAHHPVPPTEVIRGARIAVKGDARRVRHGALARNRRMLVEGEQGGDGEELARTSTHTYTHARTHAHVHAP